MNLKEVEKAIIEGTIKSITSNVISIKERRFAGPAFSSLTTVDFPSATSIGSSAFQGRSSLTTVDIPNATTIGNDAFNGCSSLTTVDFPSATSIGDNTFRGCTALTTVNIPNATNIGAYAFSNCPNLNLHLYTGISSIKVLGGINIAAPVNPPKAVYFHYNEADEVLFSPADAIGQGNDKGTLTYNIYTDNTIIKDGVLSKADQYTIVNVYHLDGSDWV